MIEDGDSGVMEVCYGPNIEEGDCINSITSMLDDVTSLLLIFESKGEIYPSSTNLHTIFHRPINTGKYLCEATLISKGKNIATIRGEIYNHSGKVAATLIHNALKMFETVSPAGYYISHVYESIYC